jgi:hypothetical protein
VLPGTPSGVRRAFTARFGISGSNITPDVAVGKARISQ